MIIHIYEHSDEHSDKHWGAQSDKNLYEHSYKHLNELDEHPIRFVVV